MPLHLVSTPSLPSSATRRTLIGVTLVAVGYVAALLVSPSAEHPFGASLGSAAAANHTASETRPAVASARATGEAQRDFDYFPDHFQNQAKEAAEAVPTF